jgi:hypothetical protein
MSIINEALKKAGSEKQKPLVNEKINLALEAERKKSGLNWGPIFVVLVILLITTPIVAPLFSTPFRKASPFVTSQGRQPMQLPMTPQMPLLASANDLSGTRKGQFMVEEYPLKTMVPLSAAAPNWMLSGLVFAPDGSYAIINDKIARVGDDVQGAKLERIDANEVVLNYQGQQIRLQGSR